MTTGHWTDAISHRNDGQTKRKRNAELTHLVTCQHGRAAPEQDQRRRPDHFCQKFLHEDASLAQYGKN